jgi:hypothetical protein
MWRRRKLPRFRCPALSELTFASIPRTWQYQWRPDLGSTERILMKSLPVVSRRKFMTLTAAGLTLASSAQLFAGSHEEATQKETASGKTPAPISADQAWQDLLEGNARFVKGPTGPRRSPEEFRALAEGVNIPTPSSSAVRIPASLQRFCSTWAWAISRCAHCRQCRGWRWGYGQG